MNISINSSSVDASGPLEYATLYMQITTCLASVLVGLPVNSYVIGLIATGTGNGMAAEIFSLNLAICEVFMSLNSLLKVFSRITSAVHIPLLVLQGFAVTGRPVFQSLICVERFLAVIHPLTFLKLKPLRYRIFCVFLVWMMTFCSSAVTIIATQNSGNDFLVYYFLVQLFIYLYVQLFCCLGVVRGLHQSGPGERSRARDEEDHRKRRAFNIIRVMFLTMILIYVPYIASIFFSRSLSNIATIGMFVSDFCFSLAGLSLPFLFLHRVKKLCCVSHSQNK